MDLVGFLAQILEVVVLSWGLDGGGVAAGGEENKAIIERYMILLIWISIKLTRQDNTGHVRNS